MSTAILVVEDDENLRVGLVDNLEDAGYRVTGAANGAEAMAAWRQGELDLVVLDVMLPDTDGYRLCASRRAAGDAVPVLMLTARSLEEDVVRGLDAGADDYLAKPYRLGELMARVRALLRRRGALAAASERFGAFTVDRAAHRVRDGAGAEVALTRTEYDLLVHLLDHRGAALDRNAILDAVWGVDVIVEERTVDNFVSSLKKKLGWRPDAPFRIQTVRGVGYRMEVDAGGVSAGR